MRLWIVVLSLLACLMPWRAPFAQEAPDAVLRDALAARMPAETARRMCHNPLAFLDKAKGLILGYGSDRRISPAQIEVAIEAELARLRVREMRWLMEADLDADLTVSAAERDVLVRAASVTMQDRLRAQHSAADGDGNDAVSWDELQRHAAARAEAALPDDVRQGMRAMAVLDLDGDGWIALGETVRSVDLLCGTA